MRKQTTIKKLTLQKETLIDLREVSGGSQWNNTVYYPVKSDACSQDCPVEV
ncbi:MAG TPA: hypothetical protein VMM92_14790 [Thermoanaerobaculia bacterium]|nr:hypothetical protein [Thermoanaerobaculia bacterium]